MTTPSQKLITPEYFATLKPNNVADSIMKKLYDDLVKHFAAKKPA